MSSIYENNRVLNLSPGETPLFNDFFGSSISTDPDYHMRRTRYYHLANNIDVYLLRPTYKRVRIVDFLTEPLWVERVDPYRCGINLETTRASNLVKAHVRQDGRCELREVVVEGSYTPSGRDNVSWNDQDRPFKDDYLDRPLKRVSIGDVVFHQPSFTKYKVLCRRMDRLGNFNGLWLQPMWVKNQMFEPIAVAIEDVVVLQKFLRRNGDETQVFLKADFRDIN